MLNSKGHYFHVSDCIPNTSKRIDWLGTRRGDELFKAAIPGIYCGFDVFASEVTREQALQITAGKSGLPCKFTSMGNYLNSLPTS